MKTKESQDSTHSAVKLYTLIALGLILLVISLVTWMVDPLNLLMKYVTRVSVGTDTYNSLLQENPGAYIYIYVFNITNAEAFLSGEDYKLKIEEVGPFTYQEFRTNNQFELDEEAGVMRYVPNITTKFVPHLSIADPRSINVTVPNTAMLAMSSMLSSQSIWIKTAFNILVGRLHSEPIVNLDVHSYLWGYEEPLIALGNTILPGWITFETMGLLDRLYDQSEMPQLEVITTDKERFKLKKINGCEGLKMWQYENPSKRTRCNSLIDAYEGYAYPPGITKEDKLRLYRSIFCRMLDLDYVGTTSTDTSPVAFVYELSNKTYAINSGTECLCGQTSDCIDGVSDMSPCMYGLGLGLSNAHYLHANPKIYERIDGINPSVEKYSSRFVVDPELGVVLETSLAVQVSVLVKNVEFNYKEKSFSNMVVPLGTFRAVQGELPEHTKNKINLFYNFYPYIFHGIEIIILIIAMSILAYAARQIYRHWLGSSKVSLDRINSLHVDMPLMDEKTQSIVNNCEEIFQHS